MDQPHITAAIKNPTNTICYNTRAKAPDQPWTIASGHIIETQNRPLSAQASSLVNRFFRFILGRLRVLIRAEAAK